jgi:hypothetical protein
VNTILMATFRQRERATQAVGDLLDVGFLNVEQEQDGQSTLVIVDAADRAREARTIIERHGGVVEDDDAP